MTMLCVLLPGLPQAMLVLAVALLLAAIWRGLSREFPDWPWVTGLSLLGGLVLGARDFVDARVETWCNDRPVVEGP